jgi:saccharopine dehydrogenase-like NADP-dependent oxidoreductase
MRILLVGAGGVGDAFAKIATSRSFFEALVVTDYDLARAERTVAAVARLNPGERRLSADRLDAGDPASVADAVRRHRATHVVNAVDPRFVMPIFTGAYEAGADYLDLAMSLSRPHPERPYELTGVKLGDEQFALAADWETAGRLALVGIGVEPGLSNVFARYASDHLFSHIAELGTRDGSNLTVDGYDFAPSFSIWTTIEECLNAPVVYERDRGWFTTEPFSEPETFDFPGGIGPVECVLVEHEEVLMMPRWLQADRVTFKYGLGAEFIAVLKTLHLLGLDRTDPVPVTGVPLKGDGAGTALAGAEARVRVGVSPRDVVAACLPDPATLGHAMHGATCAGLAVTGTGRDGAPRSVYLFHVVDNEDTMRDYDAQCVVWQTAINPVVALELLATGVWSGAGVLGPEAFDAVPFLELLSRGAPAGYGSPWGLQELDPQAGS